MKRCAVLFVLGIGLLSCGGTTAPNTGGTPSGEMKSDSGKYLIAVQTDPNPPIRGTNTVTYTVSDATGARVDQLDLTVVPWMPAHGHGGSVHPTIVAHGNGVYEVQNVLFYMPGLWELRSTLTSSGAADHVTPSFSIE